ncbi:MAG: hypothetical protein ACPGYV_02525 [Phycisphaeraceae bacterium]
MRLSETVERSAKRGRLLASAASLLLCLAVLVGGVLMLAAIDAVWVLGVGSRALLLLAILLGSLGLAGRLVLRPWLNDRYRMGTSQRIDRAGQAADEPVVRGVSLREPLDDDSLALMLLERAQSRATDLAASIQPSEVYPAKRLVLPSGCLLLAIGMWAVVAAAFPGQAFAVLTRAWLPWVDAPPFTLTELEPDWTPDPPKAGQDVRVTVVPQGVEPEQVDLLLVDASGRAFDRIAMSVDDQGTHQATLRRVESPIKFKLETLGRATRTYTIDPTPRPVADARSSDPARDDSSDATSRGGSTTFDTDRIAARDINAHADWPAMKRELLDLIDALRETEAQAKRLSNDVDAAAVDRISNRLAELVGRAKALADEVSV